MKKLIIALLLSFVMSVPVFAEDGAYAVVTTKTADLMMHAEANSGSKNVGYLSKGSVCRILERNQGNGNWSYVFSGGVKGYVASAYLTEAKERLQAVEAFDGVAFTKDTEIYAQAKEGAAVVGTRHCGATEKIVEGEVVPGWYQITFRVRDSGAQNTGFVRAEDVVHTQIVLDAEPVMK